MVGSLYRSSKKLTPHAIFYLYKILIRAKMEYSCHIQSSLSNLDTVQKRHRVIVSDKLFSPSNLFFTDGI